MTAKEHMNCTDHFSLFRGACYCKHDKTVFLNARMFSTGGPCNEDYHEDDYEAIDLAEGMIGHWFKVLDDVAVDVVHNRMVLPGMSCECEQVAGEEGSNLLSRMV